MPLTRVKTPEQIAEIHRMTEMAKELALQSPTQTGDENDLEASI